MIWLFILLLFFIPVSLPAQEPAPPTPIAIAKTPSEFQAYDTPNNCLDDVSLIWKAVPSEVELINKSKELKELNKTIAELQAKIDNAEKNKRDDKYYSQWEKKSADLDENKWKEKLAESEKKKIKISNEVDALKNKIIITEYIVYIDKNADGKFEQEVDRFPSNANWKSDKEWPFWVSGTKEGYHYVEINILEQFPAGTLPELKKKKSELQKVRSEIEKSKLEHKDYSKANSRKLNLMKEVNILEDKVSAEKNEIKSKPYYFKVTAADKDNSVLFTFPVLSAQAKDNWFNWSLAVNFLVMIFFCATVIWFISHAKKNKDLFLRRINGLDAVEEAVGRATEMGRPVFYMTGITGMDDIACICATVILGKIAEKVAQYDSQIKVPHRDPIVMTVCQEIIKEAYIKAGRPDAYKSDSSFYVTGDQFAYTAAVNGMMMREKPAASFLMGSYAAEALLLAECGSTTGAIQIAGSDSTDQLPFFITTCDYTLIGEEFYAASAYLSREPVLVGTLKAQDFGKLFILAALVFGAAISLAHLPWIIDIIKDFS